MVIADRQAAIGAVAAGAELDIPDWPTERERFDDALNAEPKLSPADNERRALRLALGLPDRA